MNFLSKLQQNISLIILAIFGYVSGGLSILLGGDAILNPSYDSVAAVAWIMGFSIFLIGIPVSFLLFLAFIIEHICRVKNNLFKEQKISVFMLIFLLIGLIFLFIPPIIFLLVMT